jgi:N-acyl-D-aspartate/D-glutamate deacylase
MTLDVLIENGTVLDGSGGPPLRADVGIRDGTVVDIGSLSDAETAETIDATGRYVAPGFIDIHSHSDYTLLRDPRAVSALYQGVTLEVIGNCGHGCFPIGHVDTAPISMYGHHEDTPLQWRDAAGYFDRLDAAGPAVNVLSLVPHGQLRLATVGLGERSATGEETGTMAGLLEGALEQGAWGFSTGLEYPTEKESTEEEIAALCTIVARHGGLYATHTRARDDGAVDAVAEAIRTARTAAVRLQISHLLPRGGLDDGRRCMELVDDTHDQDLAFDMHTRLHGLRYLQTLLPAWALEGGRRRMAERLADAGERERCKRAAGVFSVADWSTVVLLDSRAWPEYGRRSLAEISAERGDDDVRDTVYDLLRGAALRTGETLIIILPCHTEQQQREVFVHELCMPGSDATTLATEGPLASETFHGAYTWAAWFYRYMVRETRLLTPEAAVHKLTGQPAERVGLVDRGVLRLGARADVVVFDPEVYGERGTTFAPNQLSVGVDHVLVNGVVSLRDGQLMTERAGAVLRRGQ